MENIHLIRFSPEKRPSGRFTHSYQEGESYDTIRGEAKCSHIGIWTGEDNIARYIVLFDNDEEIRIKASEVMEVHATKVKL